MVMEDPVVEVIIKFSLEGKKSQVDDMQEKEHFWQKNSNGKELQEEISLPYLRNKRDPWSRWAEMNHLK